MRPEQARILHETVKQTHAEEVKLQLTEQTGVLYLNPAQQPQRKGKPVPLPCSGVSGVFPSCFSTPCRKLFPLQPVSPCREAPRKLSL